MINHLPYDTYVYAHGEIQGIQVKIQRFMKFRKIQAQHEIQTVLWTPSAYYIMYRVYML